MLGIDEVRFDTKNTYHFNNTDSVSAPLYQQAFRWFREKYKMHIINPDFGSKFQYKIFNLHLLKQGKESGKTGFNTYEEAELACLKKLIKIHGGKQ